MRVNAAIKFAGIPRVHFIHKHSCTPNIHLLVITFAVPDLRSHVICTSTICVLSLFAEIGDLGHSEIYDKQLINLIAAVVVNDDVVGFDVAMKYAILTAFYKLRDIVFFFIRSFFLLGNEISPELVGVIFIYLIVQEI